MSRPLNLRVFIYLRKSRADVEEERRAAAEGKEYDTLARHRRNLMDVIKLEGHILVDTFEELVTGESIIERTELQRMLKRMDEGEIDAILVMDLDRLGRGDMYDSGILDRAFRYNSIKLITPTEHFDPEDESWELVFGIKSIVARQELKSITKRLQGGRRDKAKLGRSLSKKPPYGYLRDENLKLHPDPNTAWVVKKIFEMIRDGQGRQAISQELDRLGVNPPDPNRKLWSPSTISAILKNEVYLGHIIWGKIRYVKRGGKYQRRRASPDEWFMKKDAHEPLVSQELWDQANMAHSGRWKPSTVESKKLANPLAGILKCEVCGYTMQYQPRRDRPNNVIRCTQPSCKGVQKGALIGLVEDRVIESLEEYIRTFEIRDEPTKQKTTSTVAIKEKIIEKKGKEIAVLNEQKNELHDLLEQKVYDIPTFMERQKNITERINSIQGDVDLLKVELQKEKMQERNIHEYVPKVKSVIEAYRETDDIEKKNRLLKSILYKATYLRKMDWTKKDQFRIQLYPKI